MREQEGVEAMVGCQQQHAVPVGDLPRELPEFRAAGLRPGAAQQKAFLRAVAGVCQVPNLHAQV